MSIIDPLLLQSIHLTRLRGAGAAHADAARESVFQTSTIDALLDGAYEGDVTFAELARHGDFGIGTLQQLDGEMIAVDGRFHVARADGRVSIVPPDTKTPFAVVLAWRTDGMFPVESGTLADLTAQIDRAVPPGPQIVALRIDGRFTRIQARSVPKQSPPYPPLADVAAHQVVFEWRDLDATLIGFRCPASVRGYEMVGYHLHVLDAERLRGGHLLDCAMARGTARFHRSTDLHVEIPNGLAWHPPETDAAKDAALRKIERRP